MNTTTCDVNGHITFGGFFSNLLATNDGSTECTPGVDCADDVVEVPHPPCVETDAGRDYISFGTIYRSSF